MSDNWKPTKASEVRVGDTFRTAAGDVVTVSRIDDQFMGRPGMLAFIEDTDERWYKRPVPSDADVEIRIEA
jgi:hypothetical protein